MPLAYKYKKDLTFCMHLWLLLMLVGVSKPTYAKVTRTKPFFNVFFFSVLECDGGREKYCGKAIESSL